MDVIDNSITNILTLNLGIDNIDDLRFFSLLAGIHERGRSNFSQGESSGHTLECGSFSPGQNHVEILAVFQGGFPIAFLMKLSFNNYPQKCLNVESEFATDHAVSAT